MNPVSAVLALAAAASLSAAVAAQSAAPQPAQLRQPLTIESPFHRLADTGPTGFATVSFDPTAHAVLDEVHGVTSLLRVEDFALPGGRTADLLVRPISVVEPGMRAVVIDEDGRSELAPSVRLFSGSVPGRASRVFLGVSAELLHGYVELEGELFFVSSGPRNQGVAYVSHGDQFAGGGALEEFCATIGVGDGDPPLPAQRSSGSELRETKPFLELDHQYRARFGSNQAAIDYAVLLTGACSEVFRRDLGVTLILPNGYVQVWNTTPPWGVISGFGNLSNFSGWWKSAQNPNQDVKRAVVHALTNPVFGGVAQGIGLTCSKTGSYAISSVNGSFPYPLQHTSGANWDLFVYAHETGHIYGSGHSFEYFPPISCTDGSGPDKGTIMSYCHLDYGVGQVGMRFHERVQDEIRNRIRIVNCPRVIALILGDYDGDGVVDAADVAEFDAHVVQGFVSRGAEETFDLDDDGDCDAADRAVLLALTSGPPAPASSVVRNGSGANCGVCYVPVTEPILGQTWTTVVGSYLGQITTSITGSLSPLAPGLPTRYGELLISVAGGDVLFTNLTLSNGQWSTHDIPLPFDPTLIGLKLYTQAAMWKPSGVELVNALDLTLGVD